MKLTIDRNNLKKKKKGKKSESEATSFSCCYCLIFIQSLLLCCRFPILIVERDSPASSYPSIQPMLTLLRHSSFWGKSCCICFNLDRFPHPICHNATVALRPDGLVDTGGLEISAWTKCCLKWCCQWRNVSAIWARDRRRKVLHPLLLQMCLNSSLHVDLQAGPAREKNYHLKMLPSRNVWIPNRSLGLLCHEIQRLKGIWCCHFCFLSFWIKRMRTQSIHSQVPVVFSIPGD